MIKENSSKPNILISKCITFDACRWNGLKINDAFVDQLKEFVNFIPVCPEVEIGLGCPRHPIRIVQSKETGKISLVQPATDLDCTEKMSEFSKKFISTLIEPDGIIFKAKSPSCGPQKVSYYKYKDKADTMDHGPGLFAKKVFEKFPNVPTEDEGRLHAFAIREIWLIRVFTNHRFKTEVVAAASVNALIKFHSQHKYLLMAFNQDILRTMGQVVAKASKHNIENDINEYKSLLEKSLQEEFRHAGLINAIDHVYGYFKKDLKKSEKDYFFDSMEEFRRGGLPLSVPISLLNSWAIRFDTKYIEDQILLRPYPKELDLVTDSGHGRKL